MTTTCINPLSDPRWLQVIDRPDASVFHSPPWFRALSETYDFEINALLTLDDLERPRAGVPFCRIDDIRGPRIVSLPFSDYCDPLVDDPADWHELLSELTAERVPYVIRPLHNELPVLDDVLTLTKQAKWHRIDLEPDMDAHWARIPAAARRAIGKAREYGLAVRGAEGIEDLRTFFEMHHGVRKYKYRLLAQPYAFFENIWRNFMETDRGHLMLVSYQDQVIAGVLFLEWAGTLYYKFNASAPTDLPHRPNDLLMWEGIVYGKSRGFKWLDLGLSDWDQEGLVRYKRKYATEEKTISFLRRDVACGQVQSASEIGALMQQMTDLLTDPTVPDRVTEQAGNALYRYFV